MTHALSLPLSFFVECNPVAASSPRPVITLHSSSSTYIGLLEITREYWGAHASGVAVAMAMSYLGGLAVEQSFRGCYPFKHCGIELDTTVRV